MPISKEQWERIETELRGFYGRCEFQLGDSSISISRRPWGEGQMWLVVHIDGYFNLGWGWPDNGQFNPLVKQLWRRRAMALYSPTQKKKLKKTFGVRKIRERFPDIDKTSERWEPFFPKAKPLVNQLRKVEGLELVRIGTEKAA